MARSLQDEAWAVVACGLIAEENGITFIEGYEREPGKNDSDGKHLAEVSFKKAPCKGSKIGKYFFTFTGDVTGDMKVPKTKKNPNLYKNKEWFQAASEEIPTLQNDLNSFISKVVSKVELRVIA